MRAHASWPRWPRASSSSSLDPYPRVRRRAEVRLLLTILSVLAGWSLLGTIAAGLLLVLKPLESIRGTMRKITMGVRAIEEATRPLGPGATTLIGSLGTAADTLGSVSVRLDDIARELGGVAAILPGGPRPGGDQPHARYDVE